MRTGARSSRGPWGQLVLSTLACVLAAIAAALLSALIADAGPPEQIFMSLDDGLPEPILKARAIQADGGWLLEIATENFTFSTICTNAVDGRPVGHAHVYEGEQKVATAYQPTLSLGRLEPGRHVFRIILRAQDHRALVGNNGLLHQDVTIEVPADEAA